MDDSKVAVLLEDIKSQFRVLGDGLQMLNEKIDAQGQKLNEKIDSVDHRLTSVDQRLASLEVSNSNEHRLILQMIKELSDEQQQLKRAK